MTPSLQRARSRQRIQRRKTEREASERFLLAMREMYAMPSWLPWFCGITMLIAFGLPIAMALK